ncbi:MAG: hypothetical protein IT355_03485 [Gemmatimonadaceae bacterium]|nr:hypothetical protein [Gemmatimonadaceae bacterium]
MSFSRDGAALMAICGGIAVAVLALAVWRRSWALWIVGVVLLVATLGVAWVFRTPAGRVAHETPSAATAAATRAGGSP